MDVSIGELVGAGLALFGSGVTWASLGHRLKDQGRRIGALTKDLATLQGEMKGFSYGARVRKPTKPQGEIT